MLSKKIMSAILALTFITMTASPNTTCVFGGERVKVLVSIDILGAIVSPIIDGIGDVTSIVSGGVDPHTFTLSPSVIRNAMEADLIVISGHMGWERDLVGRVAEEKRINADAISLNLLEIDGIKTLKFDGEENLHGFWLLPDNTLIIANAIAEKLKNIRPEYSQKITENYESFREEVLRLKDFLIKMSEKHGLHGGKVALGFYAEQYIAEAMLLETDVILIGEEGIIKPSALARISEEARLGRYSCIIISDAALLMENVRDIIKEVSRDAGCPVAYVITISRTSLERYTDIMYYNAGQVYSAMLSERGYISNANWSGIYYLAIIIFLLIIIVFESLLLVRARAK